MSKLLSNEKLEYKEETERNWLALYVCIISSLPVDVTINSLLAIK